MQIIKTIPSLACAFTDRRGGVSEGEFASLNLKYPVTPQDETGGEKRVFTNRQRVCEAIGLKAHNTVACQQVHGHYVHEVSTADAGRGALQHEDGIPESDGLLTRETRIPLLIMVADCYPVVLADPVLKIVAAVHSGWRGTQQQIAVQALHQMQAHGSRAENIYGIIGTGIGFDSFEVGGEVVDAFATQINASDPRLVKQVGEKYRLNLPRILQGQLQGAGIPEAQIQWLGGDTLTDENCFSYRRQKGVTGRQGVIVGWTD